MLDSPHAACCFTPMGHSNRGGLPIVLYLWRSKCSNVNKQPQEDARKVQEDGGVVIYWRPGCPFCERLDSSLGDLGNHATWVNIWEDPQAEAHVKSLNDGNAVVPTLDTGDMHFVVADRQAREKAANLIRNTLS